jgi:HEAT repeat protein
MGKRVKIALAVVFALVGVFVWRMAQPSEPVYKGKTLSKWLKVYTPLIWRVKGPEELSEAEQDANAAVRQAGTNAIPTLLRMLRAKDSTLTTKLLDFAQWQSIFKIDYPRAEGWNLAALRGFEMLGAQAQSAVPAIIDVVDELISLDSEGLAIMALGAIGSSAKQAVPSLLGWATNAGWMQRYNAITALGRIAAEPDLVVPLLTNALHDPSPDVQAAAVESLKGFGTNAKVAVPALVEYLQAHEESEEKAKAAEALKVIDLEAAPKAGIK